MIHPKCYRCGHAKVYHRKDRAVACGARPAGRGPCPCIGYKLEPVCMIPACGCSGEAHP